MNIFRLHHLLFGLAVVAAYLTSENTGALHAWIGYFAAALIAFRLLMGLLHRAGFDLQRLRPLRAGGTANRGARRKTAIARGLSLAVLLSVAGVAGTGIAMDRGGTLVGQSIREAGSFDSEEAERGEEGHEEGVLAEVHETLGNLILPLALLHLANMLLARRELALFLLFVGRKRRVAPAH